MKGHKKFHTDNEDDDEVEEEDIPSGLSWSHNDSSIGPTGILGDQEMFRKERNRMHAKLTRDRKKKFTNKIQQMIDSLERQNEFMRNRIKNLDQSSDLKTLNSQSI